ncbi:MAG: hypothetical protein GY913_26665 [Proteobacteria bacterium]|nr:hypothetical protein [Pseudomonadota bacterium]MCP4920499.1 hypothetical protein [Pseudomonadota bacterium]
MSEIWSRGESGLLKFGEGRAVLVYGEPTTFEDLQAIVRAIYTGAAVTFTRAEVFSNPSAPSLARELWLAASRVTDRTALRGTAQSPILPGPLFPRRAAFSLHIDAARLLDQAHASRVRVGDTVRLDKPVRMQVLDQLAILKVLGVIKLGKAAPKRRSTRPEPQRRDVARARHDPKQLQRARRDLARLDGADDWVVVGCTPSMDRTDIETQCQRMLSRYEAAFNEARSDEVREVAQEIYHRVSAAVKRIQGGNAKHEVKRINPQTAAEDGIRLVDQ